MHRHGCHPVGESCYRVPDSTAQCPPTDSSHCGNMVSCHSKGNRRQRVNRRPRGVPRDYRRSPAPCRRYISATAAHGYSCPCRSVRETYSPYPRDLPLPHGTAPYPMLPLPAHRAPSAHCRQPSSYIGPLSAVALRDSLVNIPASQQFHSTNGTQTPPCRQRSSRRQSPDLLPPVVALRCKGGLRCHRWSAKMHVHRLLRPCRNGTAHSSPSRPGTPPRH